jgi:hypothetical protein
MSSSTCKIEKIECVEDGEKLLKVYASLLNDMHELNKKHEVACLEKFDCEKKLSDTKKGLIGTMETRMLMDEEEYHKVVDYMFQFKREQEELLQTVKAKIRDYCNVYDTQIKKFYDMNVSIKDSLETLKRFRNYEKTLHPSHFFYKIVAKKVDVQYQKALADMHEAHPLTKLIWSFRTRISVILSMLLQKYPRLKFECMRVMTPLMVDIKFNVSFFFISLLRGTRWKASKTAMQAILASGTGLHLQCWRTTRHPKTCFITQAWHSFSKKWTLSGTLPI